MWAFGRDNHYSGLCGCRFKTSWGSIVELWALRIMLRSEANDRPGGIYTLGNRGLVASVGTVQRMPMRFLMLASETISRLCLQRPA